MRILELTMVLLAAAVALAALARRLHAPYPAFLALFGAALTFLPGMPTVRMAPELALALFIAPVLLAAAYETSLRDLRDNWASIAGLVVVAVGVTTVAVAWLTHTMAPHLPWAAAIALGAIVAPPDAAAATAVLEETRPPHRIVQILKGESLLNDATALLTFRIAAGAAMGAGFSPTHALPLLALTILGSVVAGIACGRVSLLLSRHMRDVPSAIVLQFAATFGVWIVADHLGLSAILTVVAYAMTIARIAPRQTPAAIRLPAYSFWATTVFVLNALAFVLVGLQIQPILSSLGSAERTSYLIVSAAVLATVIGARLVCVMSFNSVARWKLARFGTPTGRPLMPPTSGSGIVIAWCGMRGVITLAAALSLPDGFPGRSLILVVAFTVVVGTLLLQGLTLRPLLLWLDLQDDSPVDREEAVARRAALAAALGAIDGERSPIADALRAELRQLWASNAFDDDDVDVGDSGNDRATEIAERHRQHAAVSRRTIDAARAVIVGQRDRGDIGDDAFHRVERDLDHAEVRVDAMSSDAKSAP